MLPKIAEFCPTQTRLIVSHKVEALGSADWLVVFDRGRIVRQGEPRKIFADQWMLSRAPGLAIFPASSAPACS